MPFTPLIIFLLGIKRIFILNSLRSPYKIFAGFPTSSSLHWGRFVLMSLTLDVVKFTNGKFSACFDERVRYLVTSYPCMIWYPYNVYWLVFENICSLNLYMPMQFSVYDKIVYQITVSFVLAGINLRMFTTSFIFLKILSR